MLNKVNDKVNVMKKRLDNIKCIHCNGLLIETKDLILVKGKAFTKNIMYCKKCDKTYTDLFELERIEKIIRPSLLDRIRNYFSKITNVEEISLFKGKIL